MSVQRMAYVGGSILLVLFATTVFFLGNQRIAAADVTPEPEYVFCLLDAYGTPVNIFDTECTEEGGSVVEDYCPDLAGFQLVGPCEEEGGDDENDNPTPVDPCDDIFPQIPNMPDCDDDDDNGGGGGEETDVCTNEETDPGVQAEGPCNSDDVCPNDAGIQTTTPCPSDNTGGGGGGGSGGGGGGSGGGGGGGSTLVGGGSSGGGGGGGGQVLGAASQCQYLTGFIKEGAQNDFFEVAKLQAFLKIFEGANVEVNGVYDDASVAAVHAFQTKYAADILTPWSTSQSTGYVYLTTRKKVNEIYCNKSLPLTDDEQTIVEEVTTQAIHADQAAETEKPANETTKTTPKPEGESEAGGSVIRSFFDRIFDWFR